MRKGLALLLALLLWAQPAPALERSPVLDAALSMLEEGNVFLRQYNALTGAGIEARFPLGCPYFWGGRSEDMLLHWISPWQDTSAYFQKGRIYLYGFDCAGFTMWALEQAGLPRHPGTAKLLKDPRWAELEIPGAAEASGEARAALLRPGDLVVMRHTSGVHHVALYIGTLKEYGWTEENLPAELAPYAGYPLLIHCAGSAEYYERYERWLEDNVEQRVYPPDGGVIVTLLDAPPEAAPRRTLTPNNVVKPVFSLEGYSLQVTDLTAEPAVRWLRWSDARMTEDAMGEEEAGE